MDHPRNLHHRRLLGFSVLGIGLTFMFLPFGGCMDQSGREEAFAVSSCMKCHNGSHADDYAGPGIEDPHPFGATAGMACTTCHGGNPNGSGRYDSHVPPPPEIGDRGYQLNNREAWFNKLTLTGMDKYPDYTVGGVTYTALQYLQFVNPGDVRVTATGQGCGQCHSAHSDKVEGSLLMTSAGLFSGARFAMGAETLIPAHAGWWSDTAADVAFRAVFDPTHIVNLTNVGRVGQLIEYPLYSLFQSTNPNDIFQNPDYHAAELADDIQANNQVVSGSPLEKLFHEQIAFTCGDCHLGSAGANNRAGDFRSSGCTACHMPYSLGGRAGSSDPNINKYEPLDPDDIDDGERPHTRSHRILSVHKTLANGETQQGIDDLSCAGCHQGSNRTVMQYWGIRLDQNQDVRRGFQYPSQPADWRGTSQDRRLFHPDVGNNTFNGRNRNQYLSFEDYDGDDRDDTPPDVHHAAGMGCIDCHGSFDLHGGDVNDPNGRIMSRMEHGVAIRCTDCHGTGTSYATTAAGVSYAGADRDLVVDSQGNKLRHVFRDTDGHFYLVSRLTGNRHYLPQTMDVIVDNGRRNTINNELIYNAKASYAMGRDDGNDATGTGPKQTGSASGGFSHMDNMTCESCHSSWTNSCIGCHLEGEYTNNPNTFSNITGQRIVFREREAQFVYQSPLFMQLGINSDNKITQVMPNTKVFFRYRDRQGNFSQVFGFSDRNGQGNNPGVTHPSMGSNAMLAHSIRGKVDDENEGPRYCAACHNTTAGLLAYGTLYNNFRTAMASSNYAALDFNVLRSHFGNNTGNQQNSPLFVHMTAGLGTGLFLFDADGGAVNPLDFNPDRYGSNDVAPANQFNLANVAYNLDRIVLGSGVSTASNIHPMLVTPPVPNLRDGSTDPNMAGPLGTSLIQRLTDPTTGIVLDSWIDTHGTLQGDATIYAK